MLDHEITLDFDGFKAWLHSKRAYEEVGRAGIPNSCPLACYLRDQGAPSPSVGLAYRLEDYPDDTSRPHPTEYELPDWAYCLITTVDLLPEDTPVPASEVLAILERIA